MRIVAVPTTLRPSPISNNVFDRGIDRGFLFRSPENARQDGRTRGLPQATGEHGYDPFSVNAISTGSFSQAHAPFWNLRFFATFASRAISLVAARPASHAGSRFVRQRW